MASHRRLLGWLSSSAESCVDYACEVVVFRPPPPPAPSSDHHAKLPNILFVVAAVLSAFLLLYLTYLAVLRRFRRRRGLLIRPIYGAGSPPSDEDSISVDEEAAEQTLHHVWYIRTVGLDEATIKSIAVTEYRSSGGSGGGISARDCSVCLGEFDDGELVRLLPNCGHAFHVPCIDTWLRAHVNCPLCRALIVDPNPQAAATTTATAAAIETEAADGGSMHIGNGPTSRNPQEEEEQNGGSFDSVIVIDAPVNPEGEFDSSPENFEAREQTDQLPAPEGSLGGEEEAKDAIFGEGSTANSKGRQGKCSKRVFDPKAHLGMERSLSSSSGGGGGFIFSKRGRFRRNSSLPL